MQHVSQQKEFNIDEYPFNKLEHVEKLKKLSPACKDLFRRMFVLDPDARIDFYELARHEMFKELYAKDNEYTAEVE
jgi:serine/threonine protein kinase